MTTAFVFAAPINIRTLPTRNLSSSFPGPHLLSGPLSGLVACAPAMRLIAALGLLLLIILPESEATTKRKLSSMAELDESWDTRKPEEIILEEGLISMKSLAPKKVSPKPLAKKRTKRNAEAIQIGHGAEVTMLTDPPLFSSTLFEPIEVVSEEDYDAEELMLKPGEITIHTGAVQELKLFDDPAEAVNQCNEAWGEEGSGFVEGSPLRGLDKSNSQENDENEIPHVHLPPRPSTPPPPPPSLFTADAAAQELQKVVITTQLTLSFTYRNLNHPPLCFSVFSDRAVGGPTSNFIVPYFSDSLIIPSETVSTFLPSTTRVDQRPQDRLCRRTTMRRRAKKEIEENLGYLECVPFNVSMDVTELPDHKDPKAPWDLPAFPVLPDPRDARTHRGCSQRKQHLPGGRRPCRTCRCSRFAWTHRTPRTSRPRWSQRRSRNRASRTAGCLRRTHGLRHRTYRFLARSQGRERKLSWRTRFERPRRQSDRGRLGGSSALRQPRPPLHDEGREGRTRRTWSLWSAWASRTHGPCSRSPAGPTAAPSGHRRSYGAPDLHRTLLNGRKHSDWVARVLHIESTTLYPRYERLETSAPRRIPPRRPRDAIDAINLDTYSNSNDLYSYWLNDDGFDSQEETVTEPAVTQTSALTQPHYEKSTTAPSIVPPRHQHHQHHHALQEKDRVLHLIALNTPLSGNMRGVRGADLLCYQQARQAGFTTTFRAFISSHVQDLVRIVHFGDRETPVVNLRGDRLFSSWNDIFQGGTLPRNTPIYSFNRRNIFEDPSWSNKMVWHGSVNSGLRSESEFCQAWRVDQPYQSGVASELVAGRPLMDNLQTVPCDRELVVLCVENMSRYNVDRRLGKRIPRLH
ncbi:hypothetical protein L596_007509 [Steinernema carpocapsae]|uniref:Collagenase NC10/endostatin domain-containing protein n=1 Tax=Steinernema carpocapsae TaxID=34508 RepID=A0A4U5PA71_STECR|nr:hypothetical protein L596_007509 [Steinernema carpocapsae]